MTEKLYPLYLEGNLAELKNVTTEIITLQKHHVSALTFKGIYFKEKGQFKNSLTYLEHSASLDPENKFTLVHLASVYVYFRRYVKAERTFQQALAIDPADAEVLRMRGEILVKLENNDEALHCFLEAIKLDSANLDYRIGKARAQRRLGDISAALDTLERILIVDPENLKGLAEKAIILGNQGKYTEAMRCIEKALEVNPDDLGSNVVQGKIYELWDKYEAAYESYVNADLIERRNVMIISNKIGMLYHLGKIDQMQVEFEKLEILFNEDTFEKLDKQGNNKFTDRRLAFMGELVKKASNFLKESMASDPDQNLYLYLRHHEFLDFFVFLITQLELAAEEDRFTSEKQIRQNIKTIEDFLNSRFVDFRKKQKLEYIDESPFIESYKRCLVKLFRIFVVSFEASKKKEFSVEKTISLKEFNFFPLMWNQKHFARRTRQMFEWNNFKNYIQSLSDKYDNFFTSRFWEDILNLVTEIREDVHFRRRLKNYRKIARFVEFDKNKMRQKIVDFLPSHFVGALEEDAHVLAFVDFEEMKEILSRSYFPKHYSNQLKFRNLIFLLIHPITYRDSSGSVMLRSTESITKDNQEFTKFMLDESFKIISFSYEAKNIYTPGSKKDIVEVVIDSFFMSAFEIEFEGHLIEKNIDFQIPAENYMLMINLRIKTKKGNLYRKVKVTVDELKRGCMNFVDIFEENQTGSNVTHLEKSGRIGLYIL